jgi:thiamine-phosphate pyrophosphorylase
MNLKDLEYYCFIKEYRDLNLTFVDKVKNIKIIYSYNNKSNLKDLLLLEKLCIKNKIKLYISNYERNLNFLKIHGVYISSDKKLKPYYLKKNFEIIGTAHNQLEYSRKKEQGCSKIFLSPLFRTKKYSNNKILGIIKFNLISKNWDTKMLALGGLNSQNIKLLRSAKVLGFGGISFFNKKTPPSFN